MERRPLLVVQHEDECPPALFARWLGEEGIGLDLRRPYAGGSLPGSLDEYAGLLVLGGHMGANDDDRHPWLTGVKELFREAAARRTPALGICLGHQLAAVALGGTVVRNPRGRQQGLIEVGWTDAAAHDPLVAGLATPRRGIQWNDDLVTVRPPGTTVLAETGHGELQVARFAPTVWGVQLHPEADHPVVRSWVDPDPSPAAERDLALVGAAAAELAGSWRPLAASFAALAGARPAVA